MEVILWRFRTLFSLLLCSIILFKVHCQAAPSPQDPDTAALSKISPRGSHWAVGHLMGKKSLEEYPYLYDGGERAAYSEGDKPAEGPQQWREALHTFLRMMEANEPRNSPALREPKLYSRKTYNSEDIPSYKEMLDYLFQLMRENAQS